MYNLIIITNNYKNYHTDTKEIIHNKLWKTTESIIKYNTGITFT